MEVSHLRCSAIRRFLVLTWVIPCAIAALPRPAADAATAVTYTWMGRHANNDWTDDANWLGDAAPPSSLTLTDLVFGEAVATLTNIDSRYRVHSLMFANGASAYTFDGDELVLGAGGLGPVHAIEVRRR